MNDGPPARVFVGLKIAPDIARTLARHAQLLDRAQVRLVPSADIHLTLVPPWNETSIAEATAKLRQAVRGFHRFPLTFERLGYGPTARRPRLLWAECASNDDIARLRSALLDVYGQSDERPFRPHVTLARIRTAGATGARKNPVDQRLALVQQIESVELFRSPAPGDAGYQILASIPIAEAPRPAAAPS